MSVSVQISEVINRPVADVFRIHAIEHVRNHPRWDPLMQLEKITPGPIGVGSILRRINSHSGTPVEGTMEVVEFELNRSIAMVIHDGPTLINSRAQYEAVSENRTILKIDVEIPDMDESMAVGINSGMQEAIQNMKKFIESEV